MCDFVCRDFVRGCRPNHKHWTIHALSTLQSKKILYDQINLAGDGDICLIVSGVMNWHHWAMLLVRILVISRLERMYNNDFLEDQHNSSSSLDIKGCRAHLPLCKVAEKPFRIHM